MYKLTTSLSKSFDCILIVGVLLIFRVHFHYFFFLTQWENNFLFTVTIYVAFVAVAMHTALICIDWASFKKAPIIFHIYSID